MYTYVVCMYVSIYLSIYLSIYSSIYLSIYLYICIFIHTHTHTHGWRGVHLKFPELLRARVPTRICKTLLNQILPCGGEWRQSVPKFLVTPTIFYPNFFLIGPGEIRPTSKSFQNTPLRPWIGWDAWGTFVCIHLFACIHTHTHTHTHTHRLRCLRHGCRAAKKNAACAWNH
jgi:hypothetical protein